MLLELTHIHAGYNDIDILHDVSLTVDAGEIVALIGPNGAGKSTLLKTIVSLATVKSGSIQFQNKEIARLPTHSLLEEGIGFVPQGRLVFESLSVRENLEMGGYLLHRKEILKTNLERVFYYFPVLKKKSHIRAGLLSGGEQQMLAIGRSLMMTPKLLMLDEPSLGLSPKIKHEMFEKLMEINSSGTALLIVEQNVRLVLRYASRGYLLAAGTIRHGAPSKALGSDALMRGAYLL